jgi:hypothetical protein
MITRWVEWVERGHASMASSGGCEKGFSHKQEGILAAADSRSIRFSQQQRTIRSPSGRGQKRAKRWGTQRRSWRYNGACCAEVILSAFCALVMLGACFGA